MTPLQRALQGLSLTRESHAQSLVAAAKSALLAKDHARAWLLADRLHRIIGGSEAAPLLMRGAALAGLGFIAAARADLAEAGAIDPQHALLKPAGPPRNADEDAAELPPSEPAIGLKRATAAPGLLVIVPVYADAAATRLCLDSLERALPAERPCRVLLVDDAGEEPAIREFIDEIAVNRRFGLLRNARNLGFAASINRGLELRGAREDVLLVNADTVLPLGSIDRLVETAAADPTIGTVTPLSNNGEDTSIPRRFRPNPLPFPHEVEAIDRLAFAVHGTRAIDLVNGVGFCLLIRAAVFRQVPALPTDYGRGYYEDVAFCLEAAAAGYRNVCAAGVYVGHAGSRSFKGERRALIRRNLSRLSQRFPHYVERAHAFERADPLKAVAAAIERLALRHASALRLLVVPEALPASVVGAIARGVAALPGEDDARMVIVHRRDASRCDLSGADGAAPQNLSLDRGEWEKLASDLTESGNVEALCLADPADLADDALASLAEKARRTLLVSVGDRDGGVPPGWIRVAATPALGRRLNLPALFHNIPSEPACPTGHKPILAVWAGRLDGAARKLLLALAPHAIEHGLSLALMGREDRDSALLEAGVWVTGEMPQAEIPAWLRTSGASAVIVLDRAHGLALAECDGLIGSGVRLALFDPAPEPGDPWLALDPNASDDAIAISVLRWAARAGAAAQASLASLNSG